MTEDHLDEITLYTGAKIRGAVKDWDSVRQKIAVLTMKRYWL